MKFNENNIGKRTVIKVDSIRKCSQCKCDTNYLDYCTEDGICSPECYDKYNETLNKLTQENMDKVKCDHCGVVIKKKDAMPCTWHNIEPGKDLTWYYCKSCDEGVFGRK